jgi:hypothetical protein
MELKSEKQTVEEPVLKDTMKFKMEDCKQYISLYDKNDEGFLKQCIKQCHDGMKHLNHWNYPRTVYFNALPKNLKIAEIGVHCGKNAYRIFKVCKPSHLYLIDPWDRVVENSNQTQNAKVAEQIDNERTTRMYFENKTNVSIHKKWSVEGSELFEDEELDFVYIDADHYYKSVLEDLRCWSKKVKKYGFIGGHDYDNRGGYVQKALELFLKENNNYKLIYTPPAHLYGVDSSDGHYDFMIQKF